MNIYDIGTGIAEVTDPAIGLYMAGMADPNQKTQGVESRLYARAFIVVDRESGKRVVIVSADIWTGTQVLKTKVINELRQSKVIKAGDLYGNDNVLISGTHTHSGPAGYSKNKFYDPSSEGLLGMAGNAFDNRTTGFNEHTFICIVSGMVKAIENAHKNLAPGKILINKGEISETCGKQRSADAFKNNKEYENDKRIRQTDREMLLLKFVALDQAGELPIGEINWYPIHPTDRGQFNHFVSGDNKGEASRLFEKEMGTDYLAKDTFVAAFANSNCGDISGNVGTGVPNEETANDDTDKSHMEHHGKIQFDTAKRLFDSATEELSGNVDYRHTRIDMANIETGNNNRTWPAALGLSFAAGSSEDSVPEPDIGAFEGITTNTEVIGLSWELSDQAILARAGLAANFGTTENSPEFIKGHGLKPIVFSPGLLNPPIVPNILPIQILKIGSLVITGVPGEITTMAGRRLKETILDELKGSGVDRLALTTYANDYSQYITTKEEYDMQHYEGASTLFGPYTLKAYQQEFKKLAKALKDKKSVSADPSPQSPTSDDNRRITVRNLSRQEGKVEFFKQGDPLIFGGIPIAPMTITVPANNEAASYVPGDVSELKVRIYETQKILEKVKVGMLIIIQRNGELVKPKSGDPLYTPPEREQSHESTIGRKGAIKVNSWLGSVLHMMLSERPEAMQAVMHMMNSDQPESLEPILHMMSSDRPESLEPILHMLNSDQPESTQAILHMMQDQPEAIQPILHMMNSDHPESIQATIHMMNSDQPESLQPILHMMNSDNPEVPIFPNETENPEEGEVTEEIKDDVDDEGEVIDEIESDDKDEKSENLKEEPGGERKSRKERREKAKREQKRKEKEEQKKKKERKEQREKDKREKNRKEKEEREKEDKKRNERKEQREKDKREKNKKEKEKRKSNQK